MQEVLLAVSFVIIHTLILHPMHPNIGYITLFVI
jgi:hypothetical protein